MRTFEIRLVGHSGRVAEVYLMDAEDFQEAVARADLLVKSHPEFAGAQVTEETAPEDVTWH
jgi:hypothetical protein